MATSDCENEEEIKARKKRGKKRLMYVEFSIIKGLALWDTQQVFQGKKKYELTVILVA